MPLSEVWAPWEWAPFTAKCKPQTLAMCSHHIYYNLFLLQHILSYVAHSISEKEKQACLHKGNKFPTVHCITQNMMLGCSVSLLKRSNTPGFFPSASSGKDWREHPFPQHSPPLAEHTLVAVCTECTRQSPLLLRLLRTRTSPPPLTTEGGVPPLPLSKGTPPAFVHPSFSPSHMSTSQVASDYRGSKHFLGREALLP